MVIISALAALFTLAVTGTMIGLAENDRKKRLEIQFCPYHRGEIGQRLGLALGKCKQQTGKHQM